MTAPFFTNLIGEKIESRTKVVAEVPQLFERIVESMNLSLSPRKRQRFLDWTRVT
jgi:hypothetical protein